MGPPDIMSRRGAAKVFATHLAFIPLALLSCSQVNDAGDQVYNGIFEKSRQRRIAKDTANLKAGRPLQYYHSSADLHRARVTGKD